MAQIKAVGTADFESQVLNAPIPVLVDFWAPWCGPCRMMAPVLEQVAAAYEGRIQVVKVNVDEHPALAGRYGILGIPTLLLFSGGEPVAQSVGYTPKGQLEQLLDRHLIRA